MNEKRGNRREWVKTAAIIFLTVMLVLTFFSNTIMNYSLPEVATQNITSGTITAKIRGTGTVESGSLYNIKVSESRKVTSVEVRVGDTVAIGDVICYLDDKESEELKTAREALEAAEDVLEQKEQAFDTAVLAGDLNADIMQNAGHTESMQTYRDQIIAMQNEINAAQAIVDDWQKQYDAVSIQLAITPANGADTTNETANYNNAKAAKDNADYALTAAKNKLSDITARLEYAESISSGDVDALKQQKLTAENDVINAQKTADQAALNLQQATAALENKTASGDNSATIANLNQNLAIIKVNLDDAQKKLDEKKAALTTLTGNISAALNLGALNDAVNDAKEDVEKLEEEIAELESESIGATVNAEVAGTITSISVVAGETISPDTPVAVIQPEGKGFTLSFSVTAEQAKRISVGDPAELVNSWWYNDITATVASIKPDPADPAKKKLVTFNLTGELTAGQSLSLQVGEKSANYDMIVPNSAIREDNNGKFILVVESKSSPLGNRYFATRYDVEVLASDDTQSAISAGLYGYEYVITTSTKPVEAGKQVRLPD
ncbi:MAG: HlyD family efflux transporter periplasmic adaptor subunit [Lachnospiraceae bacterium]|mgnify:CR=1 FL=1|nr:HlyD family efflux transporter periplasmic adaptor subunit [Lachnospiraceae bacterium]